MYNEVIILSDYYSNKKTNMKLLLVQTEKSKNF